MRGQQQEDEIFWRRKIQIATSHKQASMPSPTTTFARAIQLVIPITFNYGWNCIPGKATKKRTRQNSENMKITLNPVCAHISPSYLNGHSHRIVVPIVHPSGRACFAVWDQQTTTWQGVEEVNVGGGGWGGWYRAKGWRIGRIRSAAVSLQSPSQHCDLHFHSSPNCVQFLSLLFLASLLSVVARDAAATLLLADGYWALAQLIDRHRVCRGLNQPQVELVGFSVDSPRSPVRRERTVQKCGELCAMKCSAFVVWCGLD